jgi:hypothetical protein
MKNKMKRLLYIGNKISNAFSCVVKEIRWLFSYPPYPWSYLIVLVENSDLRGQELFDEMKQLEKKGYSILMLPSMWLRNIYQDKVDALWALEKREQPKPQWIFLTDS